MNFEQDKVNKKPRRAKRALIISLLVFVLMLCFALAVAAPTISNVNFWWSWLSPKITKVVGGSRLECSQVNWCGPLKICANYCENNEKSVIIEHFSISPITGEIRISEWALANLPKTSKKKQFPRIPLPISVIILQKGDLSLVSEQFPPLDYIKLNRLSLTGSHWLTSGYFNEKRITWNGIIGDNSNIKAKIQDFSLNYNHFKALSEGELEIVNDGYKSKPVELEFKNFKLQKTSWFNHKLPPLQINGVLVLDELLHSLIGAKRLDLKSGKIHIYSVESGIQRFLGQSSSLSLKLAAFPAEELSPYLSFINLPQSYDLRSLSGSLAGAAEISFKNLKQTKYKLQANSLSAWIVNPSGSAASFGPVTGEVQLKGQKILVAKLKTERKIDVRSLAILIPKQKFKLEEGALEADLNYNSRIQAVDGKFLVSNLTASELATGLGLEKGNGSFQLKNNSFKGLLTAYLKNSNDLVEADLNLSLFPALGGTLQVAAPKLTLSNLNLPNKNIELIGSVKDFKSILKLKNAQPNSLKAVLEVENLKVQIPTLTDKPFEFNGGKLELAENNEITVRDLALNLKQGDKAKINGSYTVSNLWAKPVLRSKDLTVDFQSSFEAFLDTLSSLKQTNLAKILSEVKEPAGELNGQIRLKGDKLTDFKFTLKGLAGRIKEGKIDSGNGLLVLNANRLNFEDLSFNYGSKSKLNLSGFMTVPTEMPKLKSRKILTQVLSSFNGKLEGILYPNDLIDNVQQKKYNVVFSKGTHFPFTLKMTPGAGSQIALDFESRFNSIGAIKSDWVVTEDSDFPGYVIAEGFINSADGSFDFNKLDCAINGLNLSAEASGKLTDFSFKAYTDPLLNIGKLFKSVKGVPLKGSLSGWVEGHNLNFFNRQTFWNNLKLSVKTDEDESITVGPAELADMETYFESKNAKGFATIVVERGKIKDLPFQDLNSSLNLQGNNLSIAGLNFKTAGGEVDLSGSLDLARYLGSFGGKAKNVNVGRIARGLTGQRGFSGTGDFTFNVDGSMESLIKGQKPVAASGSFNLRNGNASQVLSLQKKLNLANVIFGGPLALNMNGLLEILDPTDNGYYRALYGNWKLNQNTIILPEVSYRGTNELNLNLAAVLNRSNNFLNVNIVGSIPRTPVRVNSAGQTSDFLNIFSQMNVNNVLGNLPLFNMVFDARPRVFKFTMKGNLNNQSELNNSASNSFVFLDSALYQNLPRPSLPEK